MSVFELTAKSQMYLGGGNVIEKGEHLRMNIHSLSAQTYNLFSTPENRRQLIQQFSVNGIDAKAGSSVLNAGNWDVKKMPDVSFHRTVGEGTEGREIRFRPSWNETPNKEVIDAVDMKKGCIDIVGRFFQEGKDLEFAEKGLEGRCKIISEFYDSIKGQMGIDAKISFCPKGPNDCGCYSNWNNKIELNSDYLENSDCTGLMNTILHESRHAFQHECVNNPKFSNVNEFTRASWKNNFDNYISPEDDFEAYEDQEIEKDANYFADGVMNKGMDYLNYA